MASKIVQDSPTWLKIAHNMPPRGSKTAQRRLEVARKLFNYASEKPKSSNLRHCWCDPEGFQAFLGSALVACTSEPDSGNPLLCSAPPPVPGRIQREQDAMKKPARPFYTSRGSPN